MSEAVVMDDLKAVPLPDGVYYLTVPLCYANVDEDALLRFKQLFEAAVLGAKLIILPPGTTLHSCGNNREAQTKEVSA